MHNFKYRNNQLYCEQVKISEIAQRFGTPVYIYSRKTLIDHYQKIKKAFVSIRPLICFSVKANSNLAVLKVLADSGAGMDVVSGGELYRALKVGTSPERIVYAGVGKSKKEITAAIKARILFFNAESLPELALIERIAGHLNRRVNISLRINPDIEAHTHKFISTGKKINKFGLDMHSAKEIFLRRRIFPHLNLIGIHIHIGSQITDYAPYVVAIRKIATLINFLKSKNIPLKYFNIGGGMGIAYGSNEAAQTAQEFAQGILPLLKRIRLRVILEPGRFVAGNSGILVTRIAYIKKTPNRNFAIVDAGMNDLIRPSLYNAYHEILSVFKEQQPSDRNQRYDIVGPICESADFLAKNRPMPSLQAQGLLAVMGAGAYGFVMSSNYNSRPRVCEVLVDKNKFYLIRKRETYSDLTRNEIIPEDL